jgi:RNA polymerase sigma-70 factor (ECF subfamily)
MEWTDSAAAEEARKGNQHAFRVLVERHSRSIFRLAFRMTGNQQDAEDMVQEAFLRAWKQMHRFDGRASFGTWIYRIAANCSLDLIRARKVHGEQQPIAGVEGEPGTFDNVATDAPSPERLTHSSQIARLLGPALAELSEMERTAFLLRHYEGCGTEEIARVLNVQTNAAKQTVFRAVQKLRRTLEPAWGMPRGVTP